MEKINRLFKNQNIYVADSKIHGRGVFSDADILPGEIIEQAHVIHPDKKSAESTDKNFLKYFFFWPYLAEDWKQSVDKNGTLSIDQISYPACILGFGMIYNHSANPNVLFEIDVENNIIEYLLFMYQMEDLMRSCNLNINAVVARFIEPHIQDKKLVEDYKRWYNHIIDDLKSYINR